MNIKRVVATAGALLCCAVPAAAQGVQLNFQNGLVTLSAENVPLRAILTEWARVGGTRIVNGDRVPGGLVTLELVNVPERQALDTLLRTASGYLAGPRPPGDTGRSSFASVLILPTSSAPRTAAPAQPVQQAPQPFAFSRPVPRTLPQVQPPPDPDDDRPDLPSDEQINNGSPQQPRGAQRGSAPVRPTNQPAAPRPVQPADPDDDTDDVTPAPVVPNNPFVGPIVGSSQPGVITPVPQQPPQPRPRADQER